MIAPQSSLQKNCDVLQFLYGISVATKLREWWARYSQSGIPRTFDFNPCVLDSWWSKGKCNVPRKQVLMYYRCTTHIEQHQRVWSAHTCLLAQATFKCISLAPRFYDYVCVCNFISPLSQLVEITWRNCNIRLMDERTISVVRGWQLDQSRVRVQAMPWMRAIR